MRISATQLESFRLWSDPNQDWMPEEDLIATIKGAFTGNHKVWLGQAFGAVLEDPDRYVVPSGYRIAAGPETFEFGADMMDPCFALMDRRGVYEAKATKEYDGCTVVAKADQIVGARLIEHKTTLSTFDFAKYAESYQWRFMADIFQPSVITYHVFCLSESTNGVIDVRSIESFNLFPYADLHADCCALLKRFTEYVTAKGLDGVLRARQEAAA